MCLHAIHMHMCTFWVLDGMGSPGPEVTGGFKPRDVKAEKAESFLLLVTYPSPHVSP